MAERENEEMTIELKKAKEEKLFRYLEENLVKGALYFGCLKIESWYEISKTAWKNKEWSLAIMAAFVCCLAPIAVSAYAGYFIVND